MKTYKCGINPESNVHLVFRGGCEKLLTPEESYRCTGCNQRFHKDCIIEHFKLEKEHDWGRKDERQAVIKEIEELLVDEGGGETHNTTHLNTTNNTSLTSRSDFWTMARRPEAASSYLIRVANCSSA